MKPYLLLSILFVFLISCSSQPEYIENGVLKNYNFDLEKNTRLSYKTTSLFYHDSSGKVRLADSALISYRLLEVTQNDSGSLYKWELLPGSSIKEVADTLIEEFSSNGMYQWYNKELFEGAEIKSLVIPFPSQQGTAWETRFMIYPAKGYCRDVDTIVKTPAGSYPCFKTEYTFYPDYMMSFVKDTSNTQIEAVVSNYYSTKGKVASFIDYWVIDKNNPGNKWKILENKTVLMEIRMKKND